MCDSSLSIQRHLMANAALVFFGCLIFASSSDAAVISGFDPARHSRFLANGSLNPGFFIEEGDISGIASNPADPGNRAALITPQHYITARHAKDNPTITTPTFRGSDGVFRTYNATSFVDLTTDLPGGGTATSDIRLYRLDAPIPAAHGVTPMALLDGDISNLVGKEFYVIGQNNEAGRNVVDNAVLVTFSGGGSPSYAIQYSFDTIANGGTGGLGDDEAGLIDGDSGHSALIQIGDDVALIGTHFGIDISMGQDPANGDLYNSFSTLITPYLSEIKTITISDGFAISTLSISAVPEPNTLAGIALAGLLAFKRRYHGAQKSRKTLPH